MSLILDALKRAERDRRAEPMTGLEVPILAKPKRRRWWLRAAVAIVLLFAVLLVLGVAIRLFGTRSARPLPAPVVRAQPAKPQPSPAPTPVPAATAVPMPAPAKPAPIPGTESASTLDELTEEPAPPPVASAPPSQRAAAKPAASAAATSAPVAAPAATSGAPSPAAAPVPAKADGAPATEPTSAPAEGEHEIPAALNQPAPLRKLREMPPEFRADFPALNLQVHNYEKDSALRFVIVNDHRYKEGDRLAEGPQIVEIVHDGMVVEYRGEKLLYTIGR